MRLMMRRLSVTLGVEALQVLLTAIGLTMAQYLSIGVQNSFLVSDLHPGSVVLDEAAYRLSGVEEVAMIVIGEVVEVAEGVIEEVHETIEMIGEVQGMMAIADATREMIGDTDMSSRMEMLIQCALGGVYGW